LEEMKRGERSAKGLGWARGCRECCFLLLRILEAMYTSDVLLYCRPYDVVSDLVSLALYPACPELFEVHIMICQIQIFTSLHDETSFIFLIDTIYLKSPCHIPWWRLKECSQNKQYFRHESCATTRSKIVQNIIFSVYWYPKSCSTSATSFASFLRCQFLARRSSAVHQGEIQDFSARSASYHLGTFSAWSRPIRKLSSVPQMRYAP